MPPELHGPAGCIIAAALIWKAQCHGANTGRSSRRLRFPAPKLKSADLDGLLDLDPRQIVRRRPLGGDDADHAPWPEALRQLAAGDIVGECPQLAVGFRLEDEELHGVTSLCGGSGNGARRPRGAPVFRTLFRGRQQALALRLFAGELARTTDRLGPLPRCPVRRL